MIAQILAKARHYNIEPTPTNMAIIFLATLVVTMLGSIKIVHSKASRVAKIVLLIFLAVVLMVVGFVCSVIAFFQ